MPERQAQAPGLSSPARPQLLLAVCEKGTPIGTSCQGAMLPSITNVINLADSHDRAAFAMVTHVKQEPRERENSESKEEVRPRARAASAASLPARWNDTVISRGGFRARGTDQNLSLRKGLSVVPVQLLTVSCFVLRYS